MMMRFIFPILYLCVSSVNVFAEEFYVTVDWFYHSFAVGVTL